jgi:hypothetical protein
MGKIWKAAHDALDMDTMVFRSPKRITTTGPTLLSTRSTHITHGSLMGEEEWPPSVDSTVPSAMEQDLTIFVESANDSPVLSLPSAALHRSKNALLEMPATEPMSSGFTSPATTVLGPECNVSMGIAMTSSIRWPKQDPNSDELSHGSSELVTTSHGLRLPFPMSERELEQSFENTNISNVDAWLDTVVDEGLPRHPSVVEGVRSRRCRQPSSSTNNSPTAVRRRISRLPGSPVDDQKGHVLISTFRSTLKAGSNKENEEPLPDDMAAPHGQATANPTPASRVSTHPLAKRSQETPIRHDSSINPLLDPTFSTRPRVPTHRYLPDTPKGLFSLPPRRKKLKASTPIANAHSPNMEIAEDEDLVEISPNVTAFRKGKEPKRMRTASYFDTDIFPELSPVRQGKKKTTVHDDERERDVVADHPKSKNMTGPKAFVEEAERAVFDGV